VSTVEAQQEPTDFNSRVGANVRWFRKAAGVSQSELAQRLAERGFQFSQTTVVKTEQGIRPLKFEEAVAVGEILGVQAEDLTEIRSRAQEFRAALLQLRNVEESLAVRRREIVQMEAEVRRYERLKDDAVDRLAAVGAWQDETGVWHAQAEDGYHMTTSPQMPRVPALLRHAEEASNG
jgi:transcriptional regulator with XRE-family HTH domain